MHRAILIQCLPAIIALAISFVAVVLLIKLSGAKLNLRRLRELHQCQDGGVQSLSFVLTLPMFLMFVMFIVQISQMMIGMVTVNYAAFAAARAASVWIPAEVGVPGLIVQPEPANRFDIAIFDNAFADYETLRHIPQLPTLDEQFRAANISRKYNKIRTAAIMGVAPVAPSRAIQYSTRDTMNSTPNAIRATQTIYRAMAPTSAANPRINTRIENKIRYADRNTVVFVEWQDAMPRPDSVRGPTYNPVAHPMALLNYEEYGFKTYEVGWQDPVSVYVVHRFALFPGPGRYVADLLVRPLGVPARVRQMIPANWQSSYVAESNTYSVLIPAAVTLPAEGIQSTRPYVHTPN